MINISSDNFVWTGNKGVCDITDLPPTLARQPSDAAFLVESSKTGNILKFHFVSELIQGYREDREVVGWRYRATEGFIIDILND